MGVASDGGNIVRIYLTQRNAYKMHVLHNLLPGVMLAIVVLLSGCATSAGNNAVDTSHEIDEDHLQRNMVNGVKDLDTLLMISHQLVSKPDLYHVAPVAKGKATVVFVHGGRGDPGQFRQFIGEYEAKYNIFVFCYDYLDELEVSASLLRERIGDLKTTYQPGSLVIIGHSYGSNVVWQAILGSDEKQRHFFRNAALIQLSPSIMGDNRAENCGLKKRMSRFVGFWGAPDYSRLGEAADPEGEIIQSFVSRADDLFDTTAIVITFTDKKDHRGPRRRSSQIFKDNYQRYVVKDAFVVSPRIIDGEEEDVHVSIIDNLEVVKFVGELIDLVVSAAKKDEGIKDNKALLDEAIEHKRAEWHNQESQHVFTETKKEDRSGLNF
jgi:pimeloyl-ACP methyl ester carboxylesterase